MTFYLKRHDTSPALLRYLRTDAGPLDLAGASVVFNMARRVAAGTAAAEVVAEVVVSRRPAVVVEAGAGLVRYDWRPEDTARAGAYWAEFEVTYADGTVETVPNADMIDIRIREDIA
ncbi:MAG: phage baseplate upper protein [Pigmentiphaga sp.]|nr:phage baseplate upper protein [Pigmentiphaga sp.]